MCTYGAFAVCGAGNQEVFIERAERPLCRALLELAGCALICFNPKCLEATLGLIKLIRYGHNLLTVMRDHVCLERLWLWRS